MGVSQVKKTNIERSNGIEQYIRRNIPYGHTPLIIIRSPRIFGAPTEETVWMYREYFQITQHSLMRSRIDSELVAYSSVDGSHSYDLKILIRISSSVADLPPVEATYLLPLGCLIIVSFLLILESLLLG